MPEEKDEYMDDYTKRQADRKTLEDARMVRIGEATCRVGGNVKTTDQLKIRIDKFDPTTFKPSIDLKWGDNIRIIIEKV
jgi:hypothetical protein